MGQSKQSFIDYEGFVEKFKPKRTTDDCYTPPEVYEVVRDWACAEYGIDPARIVRPFYPGGDYESFDYSGGAVVLDNPPFSILSKIVGDYLDWGVPFFLFAPSLTCMSSARTCMRCCHVICDADVEYANGAVVRTAFVTSYGGDVVARTAPDLGAAVNAKVEELRRRKAPELPKYEYPDHVVTAAIMQRWRTTASSTRCAAATAPASPRSTPRGTRARRYSAAACCCRSVRRRSVRRRSVPAPTYGS